MLSVKEILLVVVFPPKTIFNPVPASSTTTLSHAIDPTLVILPSLTLKLVPTIPEKVPVPVISNVGAVIFSLEFQPLAELHFIDLSLLPLLEPLSTIPPLAAVKSVGEATLPKITNLSST